MPHKEHESEEIVAKLPEVRVVVARGVLARLSLNQTDQRHSVVGNRRLRFGSRSRNPTLLRRSAVTAS